MSSHEAPEQCAGVHQHVQLARPSKKGPAAVETGLCCAPHLLRFGGQKLSIFQTRVLINNAGNTRASMENRLPTKVYKDAWTTCVFRCAQMLDRGTGAHK